MELKRILALTALSALLVTAGCGGPDVGVTSDEILIGTWAPLTGPASNLSTIAEAMEAYFEYINDQGGIHGRQLRLLVKDDAYDPERTPAVVEELVDGDRVFALLGGNGTANCLAVKDYITIKLLPWVNPGSGARVWTSPVNAYVFSTFPSYVTEGRILAQYVLDEFEPQEGEEEEDDSESEEDESETIKYGMLYQDDSFGLEGQEGVRLGLRRQDREISIAEPYQVGQTDLSAAAQKFKDEEIDVIFVWTITEGAAEFAKALAEVEDEDYDPQIVATQVLSDPVMFELAGDAWDGTIVASSVPSTDSDAPGTAKAREIIEQYGDGMEFGTYAYWGLARAEVLIKGLEVAGPDLTRLKFLQALESLDSWTDNFVGTEISFGPENHQGLNKVQLARAEDGKLVHLTGWLES